MVRGTLILVSFPNDCTLVAMLLGLNSLSLQFELNAKLEGRIPAGTIAKV